jgi:Right handed beta helix region
MVGNGSCVRGVASRALLAAAIAALLLPAGARAADTFVDQTKPDDTADCLTPATACKTIIGALGKSGPGDTTFVVAPAVQTTYAENIGLNAGRSLVALGTNPALTIIDNGDGGGVQPAVFVPPPPTGAAGGTVSGFTIRSDFQALLAQSPVTVQNNIFDEGTPPTSFLGGDVQIDGTADGSLVDNNQFRDPTPTAGENQFGVRLLGSSTVSGNVFDDFVAAIVTTAAGGTPMITGNEITGTRVGQNAGVGISVNSGDPTIVGNNLHDPFFATMNDTITGISLDDALGNLVGATLRRNTVTGHRWGVVVEDVNGPVTLDSDLLVTNRHAGLRQVDSAGDDVGIADVSASNLTIFDTSDPNVAFEVEVNQSNANLTLDSSTIGDLGINNQGSSTCSISFSRGPTTTGDSCDLFQTTAAPMFVGGGNYHLTLGSPMIDAGNPAAPSSASLDIDGLARAVSGDGSCPAERDMGADEFVPAMPVDCNPPAPPGTTPAQPQPLVTQPPTAAATPRRKKCKRKKRGRATAGKKRCRKKRR